MCYISFQISIYYNWKLWSMFLLGFVINSIFFTDLKSVKENVEMSDLQLIVGSDPWVVGTLVDLKILGYKLENGSAFAALANNKPVLSRPQVQFWEIRMRLHVLCYEQDCVLLGPEFFVKL